MIHVLAEVTPTVDGLDFEFIDCQPGGLLILA